MRIQAHLPPHNFTLSKWSFLLGTVGFRCHAHQVPKLSAQMDVAVEPAIAPTHPDKPQPLGG